MADSSRSVDSHTISAVLGVLARTLQIAAIVCAGFVLGSLLDSDITKRWAHLISRFK